MPIIDHITLHVSDLTRSKAFYEKVLAPLGIGAVMRFGDSAGFGKNGKPDFWIGSGKPDYASPEQHARGVQPTHIAFVAESRAAVDAFYRAALEAGAKDNGPPGVRAFYHPSYYGAFVLDPDGHNIEAVVHRPE